MLNQYSDFYWKVGGSTTHVFSSARNDFFPVTDAAYQEWLLTPAAEFGASPCANEVELNHVLLTNGQDGMSRSFRPAELIAAFDRIDHGVTAEVFSAGEIDGSVNVPASDPRTAHLAGTLNVQIGTIAD